MTVFFRANDAQAGKSDLLAAQNLALQDQLDQSRDRENELEEVIADYQRQLQAAAASNSSNQALEAQLAALESEAVKARTQHTMEKAKLEAKFSDLKEKDDRDIRLQKQYMKERNASIKSESEAKFSLEVATTELNDLKFKVKPLQDEIESLKRKPLTPSLWN